MQVTSFQYLQSSTSEAEDLGIRIHEAYVAVMTRRQPESYWIRRREAKLISGNVPSERGRQTLLQTEMAEGRSLN